MNNKSKAVRLAAVLATALLVSMAFPASAHHDDKAGKTSKGDKITYVSFGIGDHIIICPGDVTVGVDAINDVQVIVNDPTTGANVVDETVSVGTPAVGPFTVPTGNVCLGGAFSSESGASPPTVHDQWQVWAQDLVFQTIKGVEPSVDIVPSIFARYTAQYTASGPVTHIACVPNTGPGTHACVRENAFESHFKVLAQFSACGKAGVTGITDPWASLSPKISGGTYEVDKAAFVNGPIFFALDCGTGGSTIKPVYDDFVHWYNNDPSNPATGPFSGLPSNDASTCNPGLPTGGFVCLFEFPVGGSKCWTDGDADTAPWSNSHDVLPGTIGTIGWNHVEVATNLDCLEPLGDGPWTKTNSVTRGVTIYNFPVDVNTS